MGHFILQHSGALQATKWAQCMACLHWSRFVLIQTVFKTILNKTFFDFTQRYKISICNVVLSLFKVCILHISYILYIIYYIFYIILFIYYIIFTIYTYVYMLYIIYTHIYISYILYIHICIYIYTYVCIYIIYYIHIHTWSAVPAAPLAEPTPLAPKSNQQQSNCEGWFWTRHMMIPHSPCGRGPTMKWYPIILYDTMKYDDDADSTIHIECTLYVLHPQPPHTLG